MRKFLTILLLVATTFAFGENEKPPAIQALKNAGIIVFPVGNGKWYTTSTEGTKILNEDATVFIECASFNGYSEGRYVLARKKEFIRSYDERIKDYIGGGLYEGTGTWVKKDFDILDEDGNSILQFPINDASFYVDGKCAVKVGKLWGFIDKDGNWLCEPKFVGALFLEGKYGIIGDRFCEYVGIINDQYEIIMPVTTYFLYARRVMTNEGIITIIVDRKDNHYEVEKFVDLYNSNGQNLDKTIKAYKKLYSTTYPSR